MYQVALQFPEDKEVYEAIQRRLSEISIDGIVTELEIQFVLEIPNDKWGTIRRLSYEHKLNAALLKETIDSNMVLKFETHRSDNGNRTF